jgi:uncharacterized protein affecting Mg2+/Co2+ transport
VQLTTLGNFDSLNEIEIVDGEGVMVKPVLKPGEQHTYSSIAISYTDERILQYDQFYSTRNFKVIVPLLGCAPICVELILS